MRGTGMDFSNRFSLLRPPLARSTGTNLVPLHGTGWLTTFFAKFALMRLGPALILNSNVAISNSTKFLFYFAGGEILLIVSSN